MPGTSHVLPSFTIARQRARAARFSRRTRLDVPSLAAGVERRLDAR